VDDLEVVDVAVRLVEVAVAVVVVTVPLVERGQLGLDRVVGLAGGLLVVDPDVDRVADEGPGVGADVPRAGEAVAAAVTRLVVLDLHPVGDLTVDAVPPGGLGLVVGLQRLNPGTGPEIQLTVVIRAVVGLPDGAVVLGAVRGRDLVVQRAVEPGRTRRVGVGVLVWVRGVPRVSELGEDHEDLVGLLPLQLDVLVSGRLGARLGRRRRSGGLADLDYGAAVDLLWCGLAVEDLGDGLGSQLTPLLLVRVGQLVGRWGLARDRPRSRIRGGSSEGCLR
jgi:hypothetical protein